MKNLKQWLSQFMNITKRKSGLDRIDESSDESFPASDPPSWAGFEDKALGTKLRAKQLDAVGILREEHRAIMKMIYLMHEQVELLHANKPINLPALKKVAEFLRVFVENNHHHKEEDHFFPALESSGAPLKDCPLAFLKEDHITSLRLLTDLEKMLPAYEKNQLALREKLIDTLEELKDIYTRHTLKEENFLFPLAEKYLSSGTQKKLLSQFHKIDRHA